jgi:hypothetical protein
MTTPLAEWFRRRPATKAAWAGVLIAVLATAINTVVIIQNSRALRATQESLALTTRPSVGVIFREGSAFVKNTGRYTVTDLELYVVAYFVEKRSGLYTVIDRNQSGGMSHSRLVPQGEFLIPARPLVADFGAPEGFAGHTIRNIVVVFHRELDNRRFALMEPFMTATIDDRLAFFPLYSRPGVGGSTPFLAALKQIEEMERVWFRDDEL